MPSALRPNARPGRPAPGPAIAGRGEGQPAAGGQDDRYRATQGTGAVGAAGRQPRRGAHHQRASQRREPGGPSGGPGAEPHHERRIVLLDAGAVRVEPFDEQAARPGAFHDSGLEDAARQTDEEVKARDDAAHTRLRSALRKRRDEGVSAPSVRMPRAADVPIVGPGDEQLRERQLLERARVAGQELRLDDRCDEPLWQRQPTEPHAGREALARGAGVGNVLRGKRLHRADGLPVEAKLAVVVVLDDEAPGLAGPVDRLRSPFCRQGRAERKLVRRREHDRVGGAELVDHRASGVDAHRRQPQPGSGDRVAVPLVPVCLGRDRARAGAAKRMAQKRQPLGEARADDRGRLTEEATALIWTVRTIRAKSSPGLNVLLRSP